MQNEKNMQLYQPVADTKKDNSTIIKSFYQLERERLSTVTRLPAKKFKKTTNWFLLLLFGLVVMTWVLYILMFSEEHQQTSFPFFLMTFFLLTIAAIQAPITIFRQYRQDRKNSGYIDESKKTH